MGGTNERSVLLAALLVLGSVAGGGLVAAADFDSATDGDLSNGEEVRSAEDDDDQVFAINYTFRLRNHQPGNQNGYAEHYAVGLTENGTLHRIKLVSEGFGFADCEPGNTGAFGIDRGNDDPGTKTQFSLLSAFRSYESGEDSIDITFYREETLAGEPVQGYVRDQVVATQRDCYDNPSEPGWYRINGTITGNVGGGTETDYVIRDLSNWIYICDCDSRREAERQLGPPPSDDGGRSDGAATDGTGDGGSGTETATATAAVADGDTTTRTATATATPDRTATPEPTATADRTVTDGDATTDRRTATETATGTAQDTADGPSGAPTATVTAAPRGTRVAAERPTTPTIGAGPGFGVAAGLPAALLAGLLLRRRVR